MTLTHRIAHLIRSANADPEKVLALTFTNKAAGEMKDRIDTLLNEGQPDRVRVNTFHGFCLELLRNEAIRLNLPPDFNICSDRDSSIILRQVVSDSGKGRSFSSRILKALPHMKRLSISEGGSKGRYQELFPIVDRYNERLRSSGMLDLHDLEVETLRLLRDYPEVCKKYSESFSRIFVDEYQDSNPIQSELLKKLVKKGTNEICAIGDPDQAIYGFRGADVGNFYRFMEDFSGAKKISLSKNYRSTQVILKGAAGLMEKREVLECDIGKGGPILMTVCATHSEEAEMVVEQIEKLMGGTTYFSLDSGRVSSHEDGDDLGFGDMAVQYRLNSQGEEFEKAFSRAGIPYIRSGEKPLTEKYPVNIIWRFLQALHYTDKEHYLRAYLDLIKETDLDGMKILNTCEIKGGLEDIIDNAVLLHGFDLSSGNSAETIRRLKDIAENIKGNVVSLLDRLSLDRGIDHTGLYGDRVSLMSLHAAKGLEWPVVFITGCEDGLIPCSLFGDRDDAEEKRLLYVGMTRARQRLILSHAKRRNLNGRILEMNPSPFLSLIPNDLTESLERAKWKPKRKAHKQLDLFPA
jgi:superfamily I DNA/RNA helicase